MTNLLENILSSVSVLAALAGIIASILAYWIAARWKAKGEILHNMGVQTEAVIDTIQSQLHALSASIEKAGLPEKQAIEIGFFSARIEKVESDIQGFRRLLFDNPEATVTIPLIKKDIESLSRENKNLRRELEHISGFAKWFIGIMVTMSIGLLGLAVSILLKG